MRSIGKVNIRKLSKLIDEEYTRDLFGCTNYCAIEARVLDRIPEEWYGIWESAHTEIRRLTLDGIMRKGQEARRS